MKVKILVIEDNNKLKNKISNMLEIEGFNSFATENITKAKEIFMIEKPKIIILDIMLPDGNGYDLIEFFKVKYDCWVIMMTALNDIESKKMCYEFGADDYITKPFDLFELIYKLNAYKRIIIKDLKLYTIGDIILNENTSEIINGTKKLKVPSSHIHFIKLLYERYKNNRYLSKSEIQAKYLEEFKDDNRIQTFVSRVRKNLKHIDSERVLIETIYGKGYTLYINDYEDKQWIKKV